MIKINLLVSFKILLRKIISMHGCDQKNMLYPKIPFSSKVENFEKHLILALIKCKNEKNEQIKHKIKTIHVICQIDQ